MNDDGHSHTVVWVITIRHSEEGRESKAVTLAAWELEFFDILDLAKKGMAIRPSLSNLFPNNSQLTAMIVGMPTLVE